MASLATKTAHLPSISLATGPSTRKSLLSLGSAEPSSMRPNNLAISKHKAVAPVRLASRSANSR